MTTHLRARVLQAGALLALVGGIALAGPTAAMAAKPTVQITSLSSTDISSGGTTTVQYSVTSSNLAPAQFTITVSGDCSNCNKTVTLNPAQTQSFSAKVTGPEVEDGKTDSFTVKVTASVPGDNGKGTDSNSATSDKITVHGDAKPQTVRQISGKVKDNSGKALAAANVAIQDSAGREYATTTNSDGAYVFTSSDSNPIAIGKVQVGATKTGYKTVLVSVDGGANANITVSTLTLPANAVSPSASPSATASASATPSDDVTDDPTDATEAPSAAALDPSNTASTGDDSGSMLFIILGGLLVAAGIGAIVLVLMRRKGKEDPDNLDGADGPDGGGPGGGAIPPSRGRYNGVDATRVGGAPMGGNANDATMIQQGPAISDAPTMLQRAVPAEDEFPDPYGAPAVTPGNYAGPGGWGTASAAGGAAAGAYGAAAQPTGTYGGANQYGGAPAPAQAGGYEDDGYGANAYGQQPQAEEAYGAYGANQYGGEQQQRFDEPTGMYRPEPQGGYPDQGGYADQQPAYGQPGYEPGGYRGAAEEPAPRGGAYGAPTSGGYGGSSEPEYPPAVRGGAPEPQYPPAGRGGTPEPQYPPAGRGGTPEPQYPPAGRGGAPEPEYPPAGRGGGYQSGGYQGGGYGGAPEQADDQGGYGAWNGGGAANGGIDSGNGYGAPAGGGYDQAGGYGGGAGGGRGYGAEQQGGGYDQRGGGYGGRPDGGYDVPAQGGRGPQGGPGGYGDDPGQTGYYGGEQDPAAGGRHGGQPPRQQPPEGTRPGQRRSVDWMDD